MNPENAGKEVVRNHTDLANLASEPIPGPIPRLHRPFQAEGRDATNVFLIMPWLAKLVPLPAPPADRKVPATARTIAGALRGVGFDWRDFTGALLPDLSPPEPSTSAWLPMALARLKPSARQMASIAEWRR